MRFGRTVRSFGATFCRCSGPFRPNRFWLLVAGAGSPTRGPAMIKQVISVCLFVLVSSIASEARPYRVLQALGCNVTMPCDFSYSKTRRERASRQSLQAYRSTQLTVTDAGSAATTVNVSGARVVGGRPAGCPSSFCGCGAALSSRAGIEPCGQLAALPAHGASAGNGCGATRARLRPGAAPRRRHVDGVRRQLGRTPNQNACAFVAGLYGRQPARLGELRETLCIKGNKRHRCRCVTLRNAPAAGAAGLS